MVLDTIIAILAGLAQLVTAILGYRVSARPIPLEDKRRHRIYETTFWIMGIIGAATIIYNGISLSQTLSEIRASQAKAGVGIAQIQQNQTNQPASQVTVNMPPVPKQRALIALAGDNMADGVIIQRDNNPPHTLFVKHSCKNIGSSVIAKNVGCIGTVWKIPAQEGIPTDQTLRESWSEFSRLLAKSQHRNGVDLPPGAGIWNTSDLGMTEIEPEFVRGNKVILLTGSIFYGDDVGSHKKEFCMWAQRPVSAPYPVWHSCEVGHNKEVY
jgi:hypothetical protein